jgi:trimeric autotransporter adhesin
LAASATPDGADNIAIGRSAFAVSDGVADCNIAIGLSALGGADVSGLSNIAIGSLVMDALTTGICNVAIGTNALGASTTGCLNIAIGETAMGGADTTGINNVAMGTTAMDALTSGACNVAIGQNALGASSTGSLNIAIGLTAMGATDVTGVNNIGIGKQALDALLAGKCNTAIGQNALGAVTSGCHNIGIGNGAGVSITTTSSVINIGAGMDQTTASVTCIGGGCVMATQFTATSDCRSKKNIKDLPYGLDFINLLRPVSYKWKPQADKLDKNGNLIEEGEKNHSHQRTMFGLLGQQVREVTKKLGLGYNDFAGFSDQEYENRNNPDWKKSYTMENKTIQLTYDDFIAPLIKSVQELSAEVDSLKAQLKTT